MVTAAIARQFRTDGVTEAVAYVSPDPLFVVPACWLTGDDAACPVTS